MLSAAASASSIETSSWAPWPVRARRHSAARITLDAWTAASTSAAWRFEARGSASSPCSRYIRPEIALTTCANAGRSRHGPVCPNPEIEQ